MRHTHRIAALLAASLLLSVATDVGADDSPPPGFKTLFNGKNLSNWRVPKGDNGHWKVVEGVIDYDAKSEAKGDKSLWTKKKFKNFILLVEWRLKKEPGYMNNIRLINRDGSYKKDKRGKIATKKMDDVDSGIYLRGTPKSQVNIWLWPIGSGEVWGYRNDKRLTPKQRAAVTPSKRADNPRGEWNKFKIKMVGDRLWVHLNGEEVIRNAELPGVPKSGRIGLQHHGAWDAKRKAWRVSPALVQFRNIYIKELPDSK